MRIIHLLRHAKSSWDDPTLADHERPLSPRGKRDARRMAAHLRAAGMRPDLVLCSTSTRTRQTLALIMPALGDVSTRLEDDLYGASAERLLERLRHLPEPIGAVLLLGHNPGLQDLTLRLAAAGPLRAAVAATFPTCALATLAPYDGPWASLAPGGAELVGFAVPRSLG